MRNSNKKILQLFSHLSVLRNNTPIHLLIAAALSTSCASVGPHPTLFENPKETKATEIVDSILVLPTTGTGTADPNNRLNLSIPGGAYRRYKDMVILQNGIERTVKTLKLPKNTSVSLPVAWQVAFYKWVKRHERIKRKGKATLYLKAPKSPKKAPNKKALKILSKKLKKSEAALKSISEAIKSTDINKISAAVKREASTITKLEKLNSYLVKRLRISYLLLSHFEGDRKRFEADEPMSLYVAMVNPQSGKFRFLGITELRKSDAPSTYEGLLDLSSINLFGDAAEFDHIETE